MKLTKRSVKEFLILTLGTAVVAAAVFFFMLPSGVTIGSVSALAMVISHFIPLSVSVITFAINAILLTISCLLIGRDFGIRTIYTSLLMPVVMGILEIFFPNFQSITQDPLLDILSYILVSGVGTALLFAHNASSGGLDIVAKILNKYLRMDVGKALSMSGMLVALTSVFVSSKDLVVLSVLSTYFGGMLVDHFIFGLNLKRRVCIISPKQEEILRFILHDLHSGATIYEAYGAYNHTPRTEIITIVDKQEYMKLMEYMRSTDPKAFITVYSVNEISYQPKV